MEVILWTINIQHPVDGHMVTYMSSEQDNIPGFLFSSEVRRMMDEGCTCEYEKSSAHQGKKRAVEWSVLFETMSDIYMGVDGHGKTKKQCKAIKKH